MNPGSCAEDKISGFFTVSRIFMGSYPKIWTELHITSKKAKKIDQLRIQFTCRKEKKFLVISSVVKLAASSPITFVLHCM